MSQGITRRTLLRGAAGATLAIPFLESWDYALGLRSAFGEPPAKKNPLRLLWVYVPNGVHGAAWTPRDEGPNFELPSSLAPLAPHRKELTVLSGLAVDGARPHGDGPGDHARAAAAYLTCMHPRKTDGADIEVGVSIDQLAAKALGESTPFPSVELGTEPSAQGGNCDSGYSCAYSSNLAWTNPSSPLAKEINPRRAFERLFLDDDGLTPDKRAKRDRWRASVLDAVKEDAKRVKPKLAGADRRKLDEYLEALRALEKRLAPSKDGPKTRSAPPIEPPSGIPTSYGEHIQRFYDVIRFAFETDTTRVVTFMCGNEGSNRGYPFLGAPEGHHDLSHHGRDADKQAKLAKINKFHVEQLAYFVGQMKSVKLEKGTLLDQTLVVFGSAIGDGDAHNHDELPTLLLGSAGGAMATGRHVRYRRDTPLANLWLWIAQRAGVKATQFADSREPLSNLGR